MGGIVSYFWTLCFSYQGGNVQYKIVCPMKSARPWNYLEQLLHFFTYIKFIYWVIQDFDLSLSYFHWLTFMQTVFFVNFFNALISKKKFQFEIWVIYYLFLMNSIYVNKIKFYVFFNICKRNVLKTVENIEILFF